MGHRHDESGEPARFTVEAVLADGCCKTSRPWGIRLRHTARLLTCAIASTYRVSWGSFPPRQGCPAGRAVRARLIEPRWLYMARFFLSPSPSDFSESFARYWI